MDSTQLAKINRERAAAALEERRHQESSKNNSMMQHAIFESFNALVGAIQGDNTKGEAISLIVSTLDKLDSKLGDHNTELETVKAGLDTLQKQLKEVPVGDLKQLPKFLQQRETIKVSNLKDLDAAFKSIEQAIKAQNLHVESPKVTVEAPKITTPAPVVNVEAPDLSSLLKPLETLHKTFKSFRIPVPEKIDLAPLEKGQTKTNKILKDILEKPVSGGGGGSQSWTATNTAGVPMPLNLDSSGNLKVTSSGGTSTSPAISTINSSAATLTSGSVFTGTSEDVTNYGLINVIVFSDVASATNGLSIQQSPDGTNWDILDPYTIAANTGKTFSVPRQGRFFRVVYTNGGTNQASFRLQTIFTPNVSKGSSVRPADSISNENDLEQVAGFGMLYNGTSWDRARGDSVGGQTTQFRPDAVTTGTIVANGGTVVATVTPGMAGWTMSYHGTYATGASLTMEASYDNFVSSIIPIRMAQVSSGVLGHVVTIAAVVNSSSAFSADIPAGATQLRVRCSAWAAPTGTINIVIGQSVERFASPAIGGQIVGVSSITGVITPGVTATALGKAEDAAHVSGDTGVFALAVRNDGAATVFANANGDYSPIGVGQGGEVITTRVSGTSAITTVAASASSVSLLASNVNRKGATIVNDSSAVVYIKCGTTASTTSYTSTLAGAGAAPFSSYEVPFGYTGAIDAIWASGTGNARITEFS